MGKNGKTLKSGVHICGHGFSTIVDTSCRPRSWTLTAHDCGRPHLWTLIVHNGGRPRLWTLIVYNCGRPHLWTQSFYF